jgi:electron transfer flavoprotein alpha subunit
VSECKGVLVVGEKDTVRETLSKATRGVVSVGRRLADGLSEHLSAVFIGDNVKDPAEQSIRCGCDRAYLAEHGSLCEYDPDLYLPVLQKLSEDIKPRVVLAPHTALMQDLFPRLAYRLKTCVVTDCIHVELDDRGAALLMTKPIYGGNALAVYRCSSSPHMATIRTHTGLSAAPAVDNQGEVVRLDVDTDLHFCRMKVTNRIREELNGVKLEEAEVVVSGGRGIGGTDGFEHLRELAMILNGALGASRPPCDLGWVSSLAQVGLTGKMVAPNVYFAVGISGSMQHLTGMYESRCIVAINKDATANIFKFADYGIVGDYRAVLPPFIENMKELLERKV